MREHRETGALALALALTIGCGGGINDAEPRLIDGGGIGDGAIDGRVNVHIIDADTFAPVANAKIQIGEPGEEASAISGLTDSTGLLQVDDDSLDGPTTITIDASDQGYALTTWFGANGANVTIPVTPIDDRTADLPQATLSGTIEGFDQLVPDADHIFVAIVQASGSADRRDPGNEVNSSFGNCVNTGAAAMCDWTITARVGSLGVGAIIVDIDTAGTPEQTDDTAAVAGFAYTLGLEVQDGVDQSGVALQLVEAGSLATVDVTLDPLPAGITDTLAVIQIAHETDGVFVAGVVNDNIMLPFQMPDLVGDFAESSYQVQAIGQSADVDGPTSAILLDGITDIANIATGPWLEPPGDVEVSGGLHSFAAVTSATVHITAIEDAAGDPAWELVVLDGRTEFALPALEGNELTPGDYVFRVNAIEAEGIDVGDFTVDEVINSITRSAEASAAFTVN